MTSGVLVETPVEPSVGVFMEGTSTPGGAVVKPAEVKTPERVSPDAPVRAVVTLIWYVVLFAIADVSVSATEFCAPFHAFAEKPRQVVKLSALSCTEPVQAPVTDA